MMGTTIDTVIDQQIRTLQREAAEAGDDKQVRLCRIACGDEETSTGIEIQRARLACVEAIQAAEAQA